MNQIKKAFEGTKVYNDVVALLETGKATFDMVDLNCGLYEKLTAMLQENKLNFSEKPNLLCVYYADFKLV